MDIVELEIVFADGRTESVHADSERVVVGSGAHCEVRLPIDVCAVEHLVVETAGGAMRVEARAFDPPVTLDGSPITQAVLGPDAVLAIGDTRIRVRRTQVGGVAPAGSAKADKSAPIRLAIVGVAVLAAATFFLGDAGDVGAAPASPALFGEVVTKCPVSSADQARALAGEKRAVAEGKRERMPFAIADGVEAVALYETAAACARAGNDAADEGDLAATARALRDEVDLEARVHRLRLDHALAIDDEATIVREVSTLRALFAGRRTAYGDWLDSVARRHDAKEVTP